MNRLVIIGNGFDLAHKLPTSYQHFIDWYWKKIIDTNYKDELLNFNTETEIKFDSINSITDIKSKLAELQKTELFCNQQGIYSEEVDRYGGGNFSRYKKYLMSINSSLFGAIIMKHHIQNWVDIENEYYQHLKECLKEEKDRKYKIDVETLNKEFEAVKNLFKEYLQTQICEKYKFTNNTIFNRFFNIDERRKESFLKEFHFEDRDEMSRLRQYTETIKNYDGQSAVKKRALMMDNFFLNFNYTPTVDAYINSLNGDYYDYYGENRQIQIHGRIDSKNNPINFGFGDEMDDEYSIIEKKNENEYLRYIKSFQYLQNSNYKKILEFINSREFQVYIMGHSCGLSDRTLLNTIFEHEYCKSIKIFYHKYSKPKEDMTEDNYTEILQNISRHFNDKQLMRRRVVEKDLCEELPQVKLPLKDI